MKRRQLLAGTAAVALAGCANSASQDNTEPDADADVGDEVSTGPDAEAAEVAIADLINYVRGEEHAGTLNVDAPLEDAARQHSQDMHDRDFYAHRNPDGLDPGDRVLCDAAETIHRGELGEMRNEKGDEVWQTRDVDELAMYVVEGWTLSREHNEIMLDGQWRAMGVGVAIADGDFFVTAKYC